MSTVKLADGREVEVDRLIPGGRYNVYACEAGHHNLSLDVDKGVTPMFLTCRRIVDGIECHARSTSEGYPKGDPPEHLFPVRTVWRKATRGALKRARREGERHFELGGLDLEWVRR